jgi:hypothetical protein
LFKKFYRELKAKRRKEQEENTQKKNAAKEQHKKRSLEGQQQDEDVEDDDAEWYRTEVGNEPDKGWFPRIVNCFISPSRDFSIHRQYFFLGISAFCFSQT